MSRRIEIELTSRREDGSWTWRAAGAREPKGSLDGELVPPGAKSGDVLRADAEFEIDGIYVVAVQLPKEPSGDDGSADRIEILGSGRDVSAGVAVITAKGRRQNPRAEWDGQWGEGRQRRAEGEGRQRRAQGEGRRRRAGGERPEGRGRRQRDETSSRTGVGRAPRRSEGPQRPEEPGRPRGRAEGTREAPDSRRDRRRVEQVTTHRNAVLAGLRPEQLPVAEQLLRGGIPSVRRAIEEQNTRARAEGRAEVSPEPLLSMAEELLPVMNLSTWKDRALSVRSAGREAPLRELRSVVSAASAVSLDEEARALLTALRESLETRVTALREAWVGRVNGALEKGDVAAALRISARAPEPAARLQAELAMRLAKAASEAMTPELSEERWIDLLAAVVESPVRRNVQPAGFPENSGEDLLREARRAAGFVPELARLLGLPIPPPPGPRRPAAVAGRHT
jgi:hypothetical protein